MGSLTLGLANVSQLVWETGSWTNLDSLVGRVKSQGGWLWDLGGLIFCANLNVSFLLLIWD